VGDPRPDTALTLRVVALALLGYAYVLGLLAAMLATAVAAVVLLPSPATIFLVTLPLGLVAAVLLRALWVRRPESGGLRVRRAEAPDLFALLDELGGELHAPRIREVWITGSFGAALAQEPLLGLLGPSRNRLFLGLPLLDCLTPEEARAVLAHELGHLSRRHGRVGCWVYRLRETWARVDAALGAGEWPSFLFRRFLRWYVPRFDAASLALAREHELEADRESARLAGVEATASALGRTAAAAGYLEERFDPELGKLADREQEPPRPLELMERELRAVADDAAAGRWLADALDAPEVESTHPSLRARLEALGLDPERVRPRPARVSASATTALLPADLALRLRRTLDDRWRAEVEEEWRAQHESAREAARRLAELEATGSWRDLPAAELTEHAGLVSRLHGLEAAERSWERVLELEPESGVALLALGELRAGRGDAGALDLLERAARAEPALAPAALTELAKAHGDAGRRTEAAAARMRAVEAERVLGEALAERSRLTAADELVPHGLPPETVAAVAAVLDRRDVARGYLARKAPETLADRYPVYVIGYVRRGRFGYERRGQKERLYDELAQALEGALADAFWLVDLTEGPNRLHRRLRGLEGALLVRNGLTSRPLARAAPVFMAFLLLGGLVSTFADDERPAGQSLDVTRPEEPPLEAYAASEWVSQAEALCSVQRTHADLRLDDVRAQRGELGLVAAWEILRPFEVDLVKGLKALPHPPPGAPQAASLLRQEIVAVDRAARAEAEGRRKAAAARMERIVGDQRAEEAFAALGVFTCAQPARIAR
jgi:Zn-dependent protease with chaperone function